MRRLILTVGISNSGKTTWTNEYLKDNPETVDINRDDLRARNFTETGIIQDYKFSKKKESAVSDISFEVAETAKGLSYDIIVSDTNLNPKTRLKWLTWAKENDYNYGEEVFTTEPHVCIKRSLKRDYTVAPHVINIQYKKLREYLGLPISVEYNIIDPDAIIVDIDGTVADMVGVRTPFEWDKVSLDKPHEDIIDLMFDLSIDYKVIFLSGRDGCCYDDTLEWILDNCRLNAGEFQLYMRTAGDDRADSIVKEELFDKYVRGQYNVKYVLDDRQQMVDRWRAMGLRCLQVASGDF